MTERWMSGVCANIVILHYVPHMCAKKVEERENKSNRRNEGQKIQPNRIF